MSEWLKEHAWKAILASITKRHQSSSLHNRFNDLPSHDVPRCDAVNTGIRLRFSSPPYTVLTRFSLYLSISNRRHRLVHERCFEARALRAMSFACRGNRAARLPPAPLPRPPFLGAGGQLRGPIRGAADPLPIQTARRCAGTLPEAAIEKPPLRTRRQSRPKLRRPSTRLWFLSAHEG